MEAYEQHDFMAGEFSQLSTGSKSTITVDSFFAGSHFFNCDRTFFNKGLPFLSSSIYDVRDSYRLIQELYDMMAPKMFFREGIQKKIRQNAYVVYPIAFQRIHADTTSLLFCGDFNENSL